MIRIKTSFQILSCQQGVILTSADQPVLSANIAPSQATPSSRMEWGAR